MGKKWWIIASLSLGALTVILLMSIYKTTDIAFVGESLVEDVAKAVGVETKKMKQKREATKEVVKTVPSELSIEDLENLTIRNADSVLAYYTRLDSIEFAKEQASKVVKDIITTDGPAEGVILSKKTLEGINKPKEEPKEKEHEGLIVNKSFSNKNKGSNSLSNLSTLGAYPVESREVNNNEYVQFRTAHDAVINGFKIPKNTVFDAKVSFIGGKLIITALEIGGHDVQLINNTHPIAEFASGSNQGIILSQTSEIDFEI